MLDYFKVAIFLYLFLPVILSGQNCNNYVNPEEQIYIQQVDSFINNKLVDLKFAKHFCLTTVLRYEGSAMNKLQLADFSNKHFSELHLNYLLRIPELKLEEEITFIYRPASKTVLFKDSLHIPPYLLNIYAKKLLDTIGVIKSLTFLNVAPEKLFPVGCTYNEITDRFEWRVHEALKPYQESIHREKVRVYTLDAHSGAIVKVDSQVVYDYTPRTHWDWDSFINEGYCYSKGIRLDSVIYLNRITHIIVSYSEGKKIITVN